MTQLDFRKVRILKAIVRDYVTTTKPVGSERLIEVYQLGCKSATVRNEMAEMAEMGYLVQPHTSAGRIPTDRGYRYYVDELMDPPAALNAGEAASAKRRTRQAQKEIEDLLTETCRILSEITSYTSVATDPNPTTTTISRIYLSAAGTRHILMVVLLSTGHVEHRLVDIDVVPGENTLTMLANYMHAQLGGKELDDAARCASAVELPGDLSAYSAVLAKLWPVARQVIAALSDRRVYLEGANRLLHQPEFHDLERLEKLLATLQRRATLYQTLNRSNTDAEMSIVIGVENELPAMQTCSIISTYYRIGQRRAGFLGVVGPTRMNYDRAVAAVGLMAQSLSQVLTQLSLSE